VALILPGFADVNMATAPFPAVLVVPDDGDLASRVAEALGRAGFHVTIEARGEGVAHPGGRGRPDAIIIRQAAAAGPDFVTRVRRRFPEARVVFATAVDHVLVGQALIDGVLPRSAERMGVLVRAVRDATLVRPED